LLAGAENLVVIYGAEGLGFSGSQALAQACAELLVQTGHAGRPNNGLLAAWDSGNTQGAWELGLTPVEDLPAALASASAAYIAAADPAGDDPTLREALSSAGFLVVQELFLTETAKLAHVVLPAQAFSERDGSYTNGQRRVQRFYPAVPPPSNTLPDYEITARLGALLGVDLEGRSPLLVFDGIAAAVPAFEGLSYTKLAEMVQQWPIVGRGDLYYGGTTYENTQGLGVHLPLSPSGSHALRGNPSHAPTGNADCSRSSQLLPHGNPPHGNAQAVPRNAPYGLHPLLVVPITRLYDRGRTVLPSELLASRIPQPHILLNPSDLARLPFSPGERVELLIDCR
jgi:NADH-quinone oxidoreductase subunit G